MAVWRRLVTTRLRINWAVVSTSSRAWSWRASRRRSRAARCTTVFGCQKGSPLVSRCLNCCNSSPQERAPASTAPSAPPSALGEDKLGMSSTRRSPSLRSRSWVRGSTGGAGGGAGLAGSSVVGASDGGSGRATDGPFKSAEGAAATTSVTAREAESSETIGKEERGQRGTGVPAGGQL